MISRRRISGWIALLLPLMALRAMLPAGYMPVAADGELRIVMCSAGLAGQTDADGNSDHPAPSLGMDGGCLFGHAATIAPPSAIPCCAFAPSLVSFVSRSSALTPPSTGPPRVTAARAPPSFS